MAHSLHMLAYSKYPFLFDILHYELTPVSRLHKELVDFYEFVRPYSFESECRNDLVDRIQRAIRSFGYSKNIEVRSFGSFASGLYLPTADMDLVAVSPTYLGGGQKTFCQKKKDMFALANHLTKVTGTAKKNSMVVIFKAKVPILKFVDELTDLKVDISFENDSGLRAIDTFHVWKRDFPEAPQLVVIVKQLLAMRGLNEVHSGGIGGFTIICLVVSMFQLMPQEQSRSGNQRGRLGELLLNFLDLYGNKFDRFATGITMNPPGYFNKETDQCAARINPTGLTIIDPNRHDNDISGGSKQVESVFNCFRGALIMIQHRLDALSKGESEDQSILGCVLGGNYLSFINQRQILRDCANRRQSQPVSKVPSLSSSPYHNTAQQHQDPSEPRASLQLLRELVATLPDSSKHTAFDTTGGFEKPAPVPRWAGRSPPSSVAAPHLTGSYPAPAPPEHPIEYLPRLPPWVLTRQRATLSAIERYWMEFYAQPDTSQQTSNRPQPSARAPPPPARQNPPPPRHALPARPPQQKDYGYAPQPASYMQQPQDDHMHQASYNNYPPPPAHNITRSHNISRSERSVENGYSGSRHPPQVHTE